MVQWWSEKIYFSMRLPKKYRCSVASTRPLLTFVRVIVNKQICTIYSRISKKKNRFVAMSNNTLISVGLLQTPSLRREIINGFHRRGKTDGFIVVWNCPKLFELVLAKVTFTNNNNNGIVNKSGRNGTRND